MSTRKLKVTHVITGLTSGGAQTMLYKLLSSFNPADLDSQVVSLRDHGFWGEKIEALGVPVTTLGMRRGVPNPLGVLRLARRLRQDPPHIIQTWMYHADLVGGLAAKMAGGIPVAWNIRHGTLDAQGNKRLSRWVAKSCAALSGWLPASIVCCSEASCRSHEEFGYSAARMVHIPNGFDLSVFKPDAAAKASVRQELDLPLDTPLIGLVARFHTQKDHYNFVQAAGRFHAVRPEVHFLLCGEGVTRDNEELVRWLKEAKVIEQCHLLGERSDIPRLLAALDIAASSSYSEGFPNVIGEAMACGVPCVVTDAGDSALIVGDLGVVVPAKEPEALAEGWRRMMQMPPAARESMGLTARKRIEERFSLQAVAARYQQLYETLASAASGEHDVRLSDRKSLRPSS